MSPEGSGSAPGWRLWRTQWVDKVCCSCMYFIDRKHVEALEACCMHAVDTSLAKSSEALQCTDEVPPLDARW